MEAAKKAAEEYKMAILKMALEVVINEDEDNIELGTGCYIADVTKIMKSLGAEDLKDKFETNGWQWDFWQYYELNGQQYMLSGSGYYGDLKFSKYDGSEESAD